MKHRLGFTGKKLIRIALLLLGVSFVTFLLMSASPLNPLQTNVGQVALGSMSQEQVEALSAYWGVDTPPLTRYLGWLGDVVKGDFGTSLLYRRPVLEVVGERLSSSLILLLSAWLLSGILGLFLGVVAGAFRGRLPDRLIDPALPISHHTRGTAPLSQGHVPDRISEVLLLTAPTESVPATLPVSRSFPSALQDPALLPLS